MLSSYWLWEKAIDEDLLKKFEDEIGQIEFRNGTLLGGRIDHQLRNSEVAGFNSLHWFSGILFNRAIHANFVAGWNRTITHPEVTQVAKYSIDQFYGWHMDTHALSMLPHDRKVTVVCMLSNQDEYEGGVLEIEGTKSIILNRGDVIAFPSILQHRVTPVTNGLRQTAALWALGPNKW